MYCIGKTEGKDVCRYSPSGRDYRRRRKNIITHTIRWIRRNIV
jgi:hypothetical protein